MSAGAIQQLCRLLTYLIPVSHRAIYNVDVQTGEDFFSSPIIPFRTPSIFRIYVCMDTAGVLSVKRFYDSQNMVEKINRGNSLSAGCAFMFDIFVDGTETINLQYSVSAKIVKCSVVEIDMGQ